MASGGGMMDLNSYRTLSEIGWAQRLHWLNLITALSLGVCGFFGFIVPTLSISTVIGSVYVMFFCLLLIGYELGVSQRWLLRNVAFLFKSRGRAAFIVFVGSCTIGLNWIAYIACSIAVVVAFCNLLAGEKFPNLRYDEVYRIATRANDSNKNSNNNQSSNAYKPPAPQAAAPTASPNSGAPDKWLEVVDPATGNRYWLNEKTGKTSWSKPGDYAI